MPIETIRVSEQARDQLLSLRKATGIAQWNILCRWAFCHSLQNPSRHGSASAHLGMRCAAMAAKAHPMRCGRHTALRALLEYALGIMRMPLPATTAQADAVMWRMNTALSAYRADVRSFAKRMMRVPPSAPRTLANAVRIRPNAALAARHAVGLIRDNGHQQ